MTLRFVNSVAVLLCFLASEARGQYVLNYFGRNKVHYTEFNWNILSTEHFEIYYYPEMKELAERAAGLAEEQYLELQTRFNHSLVKKVPMIIFSSHIHFQQTNTTPYDLPEGIGGFFEFFKGRVVLPSDGSPSHFKRVLRHELVHVFSDSRILRAINDHRKFNHPGAPLWFTEGLAELWSGEPDFQAEMVIRDATLNNTVLPVQQFFRVQGTYYMYKLGESFLSFVEEKYGREKILLLMENIWKSDIFERVVEHTLGKKYDALSEEWIYWLRKKYYPSMADNDPPSAVTKEITPNGYNSKPAYSKRGDREELFYLANVNGYTNIYVKNLKTGDVRTLIRGERTQEFESFHFFKSKLDVDSLGRLAFVAKSGSRDVLYVCDTETGRILHRYKYDDLVGIASPSWSSDGRSIAFSGLSISGNDDIYLLNVSSDPADGMLQQITNDFYDDRNPAWSPDGRYLVFSSDRTYYGSGGSYNLFLYDVGAKSTFHLTAGAYNDDSPSWSTDGRWIAFSSNRQGTPTNIWAMPFVTDSSDFMADAVSLDSRLYSKYAPRQLTHLTSAVFDPVWTNSGDLFLSAFEDFSFKIRRLPSAKTLAARASSGERAAENEVKVPWISPSVPITKLNTKPYVKRYGLDFVQGAFQADPIYGSGGGAQIGITDMLGNDQYYFVVYNNARTTEEILYDWNFVVTKISLGQRINYAYGAYRFKGDFFEIGDDGSISSVNESRYGGFVAMAYPLSRFQRIETSVNVSQFRRESLFGSLLPIDGILLANSLSYVYDNTLWSSTGPIDGQRGSFGVSYTTDVRRSQQNYSTIIADYRYYQRLTLRSALATRAMVQWNQGKNPQNFLIGGSWDIRGYPRWSLPGTRFFVVNNELRFPLLDDASIRWPFGGFGLHSIRGAIFMDLGNIWGAQESDGRVILRNQKFDGVIGSVGTGFRFNLFGLVVLRFDFGKMFDLRGLQVTENIRLPGNRTRFIPTNFNQTKDTYGFGGLDDEDRIRNRNRWSRGIFTQFWFGYDF